MGLSHSEEHLFWFFALSFTLGLNYKVINNNIISIWGIGMFQGTQYLNSQKIPCANRFLVNIISNLQRSANHTKIQYKTYFH